MAAYLDLHLDVDRAPQTPWSASSALRVVADFGRWPPVESIGFYPDDTDGAAVLVEEVVARDGEE